MKFFDALFDNIYRNALKQAKSLFGLDRIEKIYNDKGDVALSQVLDEARVDLCEVTADGTRVNISFLGYDKYHAMAWISDGLGMEPTTEQTLRKLPVTTYNYVKRVLATLSRYMEEVWEVDTPIEFDYGDINIIVVIDGQKGGFDGFYVHYPIDLPVISPTISGFTNRNRWLSNFYYAKTPFMYEGRMWHQVEQAYQASKTSDLSAKEQVSKLTAGGAKRFFKDKPFLVDKDFHDKKLDIMRELVYLKFKTDQQLLLKLMMTMDSELIEFNTWGDTFWGVTKDGGENYLGRILMDVREKLRTELRLPSPTAPISTR